MKKEGEKIFKMKLTKNPPTQGAIPWQATGLVFPSVSSKFFYFQSTKYCKNIIPICWFELEKPGTHKSGKVW